MLRPNLSGPTRMHQQLQGHPLLLVSACHTFGLEMTCYPHHGCTAPTTYGLASLHVLLGVASPWLAYTGPSRHAALPGQAESLGAGRRWQAAASAQEHGQLAPPVPVPDINFAVDQFFAVGEARLQCCLPSAACECLGSYQTALYRLHTGVVPPAWCSCIADMRDGQVPLVSDALTYLIS